MAIPQLRAEGIDAGAANSGAFTIDFSGFTFQANDILEIVFTTDGWVPVLTTANGFALAVASDGGTASVTTNGGVAGTNDCGIFVYWKRAVGSSTATDPSPVFQAPSVSSGTSWCLQPNSYSGARTTGTPWHSITTAIVSTAGTAVTSVAASSTLANCLFMTRAACTNDDGAFNNWTFTGSSGPSGTGAPNTGWHNGTGNACAFTGAEGGFAAAGGPRTATTTFGASTPKQALVTLVLASLAEAAPLEDSPAPQWPPPARPRPLLWSVPAMEELPQQAAASTPVLVGAGGIQRSNDAPPATGTLTTGTVAAWAASTAYVVDASTGGISRVQNGGNLYQCSNDGTSAGSGGPTGTGTSISDGSVTWYFVGTVTNTNTAAGSQVLAFIARGTQSVTPGGAIDPTDNDSGSFTVITNNAYLTFTTSFAGVWRRTAAANSKTGYTASAQFGSVGSGQGDEVTLGWLELQGVAVGAPHTFSQVERASPSSGSVTAASITTTKRCLIVSFWFGNGAVQTVGTTDTAAPAGSLQLVANSSFPLAIAAPGYIQVMVAWRVADPGTFAESWTSTTNEGAQLVTVAFETATVLMVDDVAPVVWMPQPRLQPSVWTAPPAEELPISVASIVEDEPARAWAWSPPPRGASAWSTPAAEELPIPARLSVDSGVFALAGSAVSMRAARTLPATSGTFALTGQDVILRAAHVLVAGSGAFALTGSAAGLTAQRRLAADSGSFTLTGTAIGFGATHRLAADSGSFALAGSAATLRADHRLAVDSGAFALTGSTAGLAAQRRLAAGSGVFALAGSPASLTAQRRLAADSGAFTLTGTAATLRVDHRLAAGSGVFTLTGSDVALSSTGAFAMAASSGSFSLVGTPITMRAARRLTADPGAFTLAGAAAGLVTGRMLAAGSGVFALTGSAVSFVAPHRLVAASGTFALTGSDVTFISPAGPVEILPKGLRVVRTEIAVLVLEVPHG